MPPQGIERQLGFNVGMFIKDLLNLGSFGPWVDFLGLGHCLIK
jgi:hypothetical protein